MSALQSAEDHVNRFRMMPLQSDDATRQSPFRTKAEKQKERETKREALLLAAVRMFNASGFHATSLDDVASSLGISKTAIYHYLGNKEQVLIECVVRGLDLLGAAAEVAKQQPGNGIFRLRSYLTQYAQVNMSEFGRCVIRTGEEVLSKEGAALLAKHKRDIDNSMRSLIQDAIADGSIRTVDVKMATFTIAGALNWVARWHDPSGPLSPQTIADNMVDLLISGLAPS